VGLWSAGPNKGSWALATRHLRCRTSPDLLNLAAAGPIGGIPTQGTPFVRIARSGWYRRVGWCCGSLLAPPRCRARSQHSTCRGSPVEVCGGPPRPRATPSEPITGQARPRTGQAVVTLVAATRPLKSRRFSPTRASGELVRGRCSVGEASTTAPARRVSAGGPESVVEGCSRPPGRPVGSHASSAPKQASRL